MWMQTGHFPDANRTKRTSITYWLSLWGKCLKGKYTGAKRLKIFNYIFSICPEKLYTAYSLKIYIPDPSNYGSFFASFVVQILSFRFLRYKLTLACRFGILHNKYKINCLFCWQVCPTYSTCILAISVLTR